VAQAVQELPSRGRDQHDKQATLHGPHHVVL